MVRGRLVRDVVTTAIEVAGFGLLVFAGWLVAPALGAAAAGGSLIVIGWLLGRRG